MGSSAQPQRIPIPAPYRPWPIGPDTQPHSDPEFTPGGPEWGPGMILSDSQSKALAKLIDDALAPAKRSGDTRGIEVPVIQVPRGQQPARAPAPGSAAQPDYSAKALAALIDSGLKALDAKNKAALHADMQQNGVPVPADGDHAAAVMGKIINDAGERAQQPYNFANETNGRGILGGLSDKLEVLYERARAFDQATSVGALSGGDVQPDEVVVGPAKAVARGALEGGNQLSNSLYSLARDLSQATGAYKIGRTPAQQAQFLAEQKAGWPAGTNPLQVSPKTIERLLGHANNPIEGLAETGTTLGVSWVAAGKLLDAPYFTELVKSGQAGKRFVFSLRMLLTVLGVGDPLNPTYRDPTLGSKPTVPDSATVKQP